MKKFMNSELIREKYSEISPVYQEAFKGAPWFEESKCIDVSQRCVGGLSATVVGDICEVCLLCPTSPAYKQDELQAKFDVLGNTRETYWYAEEVNSQVALAAVAWKANSEMIVGEKYDNDSAMRKWLDTCFGNDEIVWLDEVFANKQVRTNGNLAEFKSMCLGFAVRLDSELVAFRTISDQMIKATERDFPENCTIFRRNEDVPDRRDFVIIDLRKKIQ